MDIHYFKKIGFSDKSSAIFMALLRLGPSSVRTLAQNTGINRGSVYDALKWLQEKGLVNYFHKDTKQFFVAENPEKLRVMLKEQERELQSIDSKLQKEILPELMSLYDSGGERPVARYFEEKKGLRHILEDVLSVTEASKEKQYRIYSASQIREHLYEAFEDFSKERVEKKISVKAIAIGKGGELRGLDERKWITQDCKSQTYILIYPGKTAYISLNAAQKPIGVVIENEGIFETQKIIFDQLWNKL